MSSSSGIFLTAFGSRLRDARKQKNKTQQEIAAHLGIGKNAISRYERGEVEPGSIALSMISCYLGVTSDWLLHGDTYSMVNEDKGIYSVAYETPEQSLPLVLKVQEELKLSLSAGQLSSTLNFSARAQADESLIKLFLESATAFCESKV